MLAFTTVIIKKSFQTRRFVKDLLVLIDGQMLAYVSFGATINNPLGCNKPKHHVFE